VLALFLSLVLAPACSDGGDEGDETLRVFAASSLTDAFTDLGPQFEAEHPGVRVVFNFAASSALGAQLEQGAPADVLVTADAETMQRAVDADRVSRSQVIAHNRLAIVVERGNPQAVTGLRDLARPELIVVLCAPAVPCGRLADAALQNAELTLTPASREESVKAVVAKVTLGEADVGIVYATDVQAAAGRVDSVAVEGADDPALKAVYPMAVVTESERASLARDWVRFVASAPGRRSLARFGFLDP
jgi:molybdate transport system substrate-binding protein